MSKIFFYQCVT